MLLLLFLHPLTQYLRPLERALVLLIHVTRRFRASIYVGRGLVTRICAPVSFSGALELDGSKFPPRGFGDWIVITAGEVVHDRRLGIVAENSLLNKVGSLLAG